MSSTSVPKQKQQQQHQYAREGLELVDPATHLPTVLGLKVRAETQLQYHHHQQHQQQQYQQQQSQQAQCSSIGGNSSNSLLKQQLRINLKDMEPQRKNCSKQSHKQNQCVKHGPQNFEETNRANNNNNNSANDPCSALQSLANAAERQSASNSIQPPTSSNLHHQFLIHMAAAANPILAAGSEYLQQQPSLLQLPPPPPSQEDLLQVIPTTMECNAPDTLNDNRSEVELMLADETAAATGPHYKSPDNSSCTPSNDVSSTPGTRGHKSSGGNGGAKHTARPVQRRRIRRKAQSTNDDQAEHLTEMSVRGLDLFRYASITEGVYQCTECAKENVQKTFKNKYSFQRHAFLYHEGKHRKVFPCPVCGKEFSRPDKMKNHMKMTHESFVSKQDMSAFHPLKYLISAAAAGEIQSSLFSTPPTQQTENEGLAALAAHALMQDEVGATNGGSENVDINRIHQEQQGTETEAAIDTPVDALLKLQQELIIKSEYISPSPSPPLLSATSTPSATSAQTMASQQHAQRLEQVK